MLQIAKIRLNTTDDMTEGISVLISQTLVRTRHTYQNLQQHHAFSFRQDGLLVLSFRLPEGKRGWEEKREGKGGERKGWDGRVTGPLKTWWLHPCKQEQETKIRKQNRA